MQSYWFAVSPSNSATWVFEGLDYPPSIQLYAIEAIEHRTPKGQKPIHWRLLTTHTVQSLEQALQILEWYKFRWKIERLFAQIKRTGLDLESTQLESGEAIQRLTVLALSVAVATLQMVEGRGRATVVCICHFYRWTAAILAEHCTYSRRQNEKATKSLPFKILGLGHLDYCSSRGMEGVSVSKTSRHSNANTWPETVWDDVLCMGNSSKPTYVYTVAPCE